MSFRDNFNKKINIKNDDPESTQDMPKVKHYTRLHMTEVIAELHGEIDEIMSSRQEWQNRNVRWYKQRYGVRPKRVFPFPGASNISLGTIDKAIKKLAPAYNNLIWATNRIVRFDVDANGGDVQSTFNQAEYNAEMLDNIVKHRMSKSFNKTVKMIDKMMQNGHAVMKVSYEYKTITKEVIVDLNKDLNPSQKTMLINNLGSFLDNDKALIELFLQILDDKGYTLNLSIKEDREEIMRNVKKFKEDEKAREFNFKIDIIEAHAPYWQLINCEDFLVSGDINELQDAESCCHVMRFSENQLMKMARGGVVDKDVVMELIDKNHNKPEQNTQRGNSSVQSSLKATIEQYQGSYWYSYGKGSQPIEVREVFYVAADKDGIPRKYVMLYAPDYMEKPLKHIELDYDDGKWPFVKFNMELSNDGWLASRGVPQILDYLATTRDTMHNQKIDRMTIGNAPMLKFIPGMMSAKNIRYIPGQCIPMKDLKALEPLVIPNSQASYVEEERELKGEIEDYLPLVDFSISDPRAGTGKSRTLGEIMSAKQDKADRFSLDARIFMDSVNELMEMTWSRWMQYGPDEIEFFIQGTENKVEWKKQYGLRGMKMRPVGNLYNSNQSVKITRAQENMALLENPRMGLYLQEYSIVKEFMMVRDPETFRKNLKPIDQVIKEQEMEAKKVQESQQAQIEMQEKMVTEQRDFEIQKMEKEHQDKLEEIRAEGKMKLALESLKIEMHNRQVKTVNGDSKNVPARK